MIHDEFYWISQVNKASVVSNSEEHLLDKATAKFAARGIVTVEQQAQADVSKRVNKYIAYEPMLIAATGPEVTILHAGRSSQDILSTMRVAILREQTINLSAAFDAVIEKLLVLAEAHRDTVVLNGTGWPLNRNRMAELLGFDRPRWNAFDCTCETPVDFALEVSSIAASIAIHVGSMVNDIMVQYGQSRPWILLQEGGENTYISSAMPQKRNPGLMNNCRADASDVVAEMSAVFTRVHNLVPGMVDGKSVAKNTRMTKTAVSMLERFLKVLNALRINPERALEELNSDWTASQEIADRLMREHGLPFRIGHHLASRMVSWARANNVLPKNFPYEQMRRIYKEEIVEEFPEGPQELPMSEAEFLDALDPRKIIANRKTIGSASPFEVDAMRSSFAARLKEETAKTNALRLKVEMAIDNLQREFAQYL